MDEYWHIGETPMRLRSVTERTVSGENKCGVWFKSMGELDNAGISKTQATKFLGGLASRCEPTVAERSVRRRNHSHA